MKDFFIILQSTFKCLQENKNAVIGTQNDHEYTVIAYNLGLK